MKNRMGWKNWIRFFSLLVAVVLLAGLTAVPARAAGRDGLVVDKLSFRDVMRLYMSNPKEFGTDGGAVDANGVTNSAKRLAEMFTYTVGLNYTGEGLNANYFGKDITAQMGTEPYADANLLATYDVEIFPYRSYAKPLPQGRTTSLRVYLIGYVNAAAGVEPVLHYVWQDGNTWYAVKDDNPYYRVSYNGSSARELAGTGLTLTQSKAADRGTAALQQWINLTEAQDGSGVVHMNGSTLVAGQGTANVFGVTRDFSRLEQEGAYSSSLLAVSDFVQGDRTYQTGPLVYSRDCYELSSMRRVPDGEALQQGVSYRFRVVYDEALSVSPGAGWADVGMSLRSETNGQSKNVSDFVWYGNTEFFTSDRYNPHTVEFTFTPSTEGRGVCTFIPQNLVGSESALKAADFHARTETESAPAATPVQAEKTAPAAEPAAPAVQTRTEENPAPDVQTAESAAPAEIGTPVAETAVMTTPEPTPTPPPASLSILLCRGPVSRGMLAETLWILSGQPAADLNGALADMSADGARGRAVTWAVSSGLISQNEGAIAPDQPVTREQLAVILSRYYNQRGISTASAGDLSHWKDGDQVDPQAADAMLWALIQGIITPRSDGAICPKDPVLCQEAAGIIAGLQRML